MLIDNAYFACVPAEPSTVALPEQPPGEEFIRQLIVSLNRASLEKVVRLLRKVDWSDPTLAGTSFRQFPPSWGSAISSTCRAMSVQSVVDQVQLDTVSRVRVSRHYVVP
jgi:regulator of nonsense transcripts 2